MTVAEVVLPPEVRARIEALPLRDQGHGFDPFGMSREGLAEAVAWAWPFYRHYFRVTSHDAHHVPAEGAAVLAANHSGTIPVDGVMISVDVLVHAPTPRLPRPLLDHFVGRMPLVGRALARAGGVSGTRANLHYLLSRGELILVFPEGTDGIGKPFSERYRLQRWTEGHVELAIRHGAPVVPVAMIGAEEQYPQLGRIPVSLFGAPWIPVPAVPLPLPVHLHVWYGEPLRFDVPPSAADDPAVVEACTRRVRDAVDGLLARGLADRKGVFA